MTRGAELDHLAELVTVQAAFLDGVRRSDPTLPVPWCGRWRVRDLVVHLARIHHWAAAEARREREVPLGRGPFDLPRLYEECARELVETLTALGPDAVSSTLIGPGPASFWRRRQLHETAVHLWDLRRASGEDLTLPADLWADTVDEVVTVLQPRQVRMGRMASLAAGVALVAEDAGRSWVLPGSDGAGRAVTVTGPASAVALLLWGRLPLDVAPLAVSGNDAALHAALAERLTP